MAAVIDKQDPSAQTEPGTSNNNAHGKSFDVNEILARYAPVPEDAAVVVPRTWPKSSVTSSKRMADASFEEPSKPCKSNALPNNAGYQAGDASGSILQAPNEDGFVADQLSDLEMFNKGTNAAAADLEDEQNTGSASCLATDLEGTIPGISPSLSTLNGPSSDNVPTFPGTFNQSDIFDMVDWDASWEVWSDMFSNNASEV